MKALRTSTILAGMLAIGALSAAPAMATTVTWTLGTDTASGISGTETGCLPSSCNDHGIGYGQASFTSDTGGVPLILSAFSTSKSGRHYFNNGFTSGTGGSELTQKNESADESGVGATYSGLYNPDGEIQQNEAVLVDASQLASKGYSLTSLSIGSVQKGEGFTIYNLTQDQVNSFESAMNGKRGTAMLPVSSAEAAGWTVIKSFKNGGNDALQNVNLGSPANPYFLITDAALDCGSGDILLAGAGAESTGGGGGGGLPPPTVPEPASLALLGVGVLGIGFARRQRRTRA